jgi:hypothetical protein
MMRPPAPRVRFVAVVVAVHAPSELAAFGFLHEAWAHRHVPSLELDPDGIRMDADVVMPGRVMGGTSLGCHDDETSAQRGVEQRGRPRLPRP